MTVGEERESFSDEREQNSEDVEAHGMLDSPNLDAPNIDHETEGDDVEGHAFLDSPNIESPNAD